MWTMASPVIPFQGDSSACRGFVQELSPRDGQGGDSSPDQAGDSMDHLMGESHNAATHSRMSGCDGFTTSSYGHLITVPDAEQGSTQNLTRPSETQKTIPGSQPVLIASFQPHYQAAAQFGHPPYHPQPQGYAQNAAWMVTQNPQELHVMQNQPQHVQQGQQQVPTQQTTQAQQVQPQTQIQQHHQQMPHQMTQQIPQQAQQPSHMQQQTIQQQQMQQQQMQQMRQQQMQLQSNQQLHQIQQAQVAQAAAVQIYPVQHLQPTVTASNEGIHAGLLNFGVIVYDLETIHDSERGNYAEKGLHECAQDEQIEWKSRSQIIEFAAVDVLTGESICVRSRPEFSWDDVRSGAARLFAEDHGHADIIKDQTLPFFSEVWTHEVFPFLWRASGNSGHLAMLAHNGDAFDHYVLMKEIKRLQLPMEGGPTLVGFDPIRSLKSAYGQGFGQGGLLALRQLYKDKVPAGRSLRAHQAMDDCVMLMEVIQHWSELNFLLASDIAHQMQQMMPHQGNDEALQEAMAMLRYRLSDPVPILQAPPHPRVQIFHGQRVLSSQVPEERETVQEQMRLDVPYMMWSGPSGSAPLEPETSYAVAPKPLVSLQSTVPSALLLSTTASYTPQVQDDGRCLGQGPVHHEVDLDHFGSTSSPDSERHLHRPPSPPPLSAPRQAGPAGPAGPVTPGMDSLMGRSVSDLEAELHRAQNETPKSSEPLEKPRARRGFPIGKDGSKRDVRENAAPRGSAREWKEWDVEEKPSRKKDKNAAHVESSKLGQRRRDWNYRGGGYWGVVPTPYVAAVWNKGDKGRRGGKDPSLYWSGAGYYDEYPPNDASYSQANRPPPKPPTSKTTEDLGTERWQ